MKQLFLACMIICVAHFTHAQTKIFIVESTPTAYKVYSVPLAASTNPTKTLVRSVTIKGINPMIDKVANIYTHDSISSSVQNITLTTITSNNNLYRNTLLLNSINVTIGHFVYIDALGRYYDVSKGSISRSGKGFIVSGAVSKKIPAIDSENFAFIDTSYNVYSVYTKQDTAFLQRNGSNIKRVLFQPGTGNKSVAAVAANNDCYFYYDDATARKTFVYKNQLLYTTIPWGIYNQKLALIW